MAKSTKKINISMLDIQQMVLESLAGKRAVERENAYRRTKGLPPLTPEEEQKLNPPAKPEAEGRHAVMYRRYEPIDEDRAEIYYGWYDRDKTAIGDEGYLSIYRLVLMLHEAGYIIHYDSVPAPISQERLNQLLEKAAEELGKGMTRYDFPFPGILASLDRGYTPSPL